MITVNASDLKNNFGHYLDAALVDGQVMIKRHGRVVAKLVAIENGQAIVDQKVDKRACKSTVWNSFRPSKVNL